MCRILIGGDVVSGEEEDEFVFLCGGPVDHRLYASDLGPCWSYSAVPGQWDAAAAATTAAYEGGGVMEVF